MCTQNNYQHMIASIKTVHWIRSASRSHADLPAANTAAHASRVICANPVPRDSFVQTRLNIWTGIAPCGRAIKRWIRLHDMSCMRRRSRSHRHAHAHRLAGAYSDSERACQCACALWAKARRWIKCTSYWKPSPLWRAKHSSDYLKAHNGDRCSYIHIIADMTVHLH